MLAFSLSPIHNYVWLSKSFLIKTLILSPFDLSQEPLHLTWLLMWLLQPNSTRKVELIEHLFRVYPKAQLFGVPNHRSAITWRDTWLRLFTLSNLPQFNLVVLVALGWPFTISLRVLDFSKKRCYQPIVAWKWYLASFSWSLVILTFILTSKNLFGSLILLQMLCLPLEW